MSIKRTWVQARPALPPRPELSIRTAVGAGYTFMTNRPGDYMRFLHAGSIVLLSASLLTPCFAGKPKTAVGVNIDFSSYKTYHWLPTRILTKAGVVEDDPEIVPAVRSA